MRVNAVPQWQGALTKRAPEMPDGCFALAGLASRVLDVPVNHVQQDRETSPAEDGLANRAVLTGPNLDAQHAAVAGVAEPILTIGGDCGVEFAPIRAVRERFGAGLGVAWFDAHPDLNTPETSLTGAFHAMVLRALLGEGDPGLTADPAVECDHVALVGARAADAAEQAAIESGMGVQTEDAAATLRHVAPLYVHVDVDVLDPREFDGLNMPESNGLTIAELVQALASLSGFNVVGAGIMECVGTPDQVDVLTPVISKIGELLNAATPEAQ